jgi:hypothetical protein
MIVSYMLGNTTLLLTAGPFLCEEGRMMQEVAIVEGLGSSADMAAGVQLMHSDNCLHDELICIL